MDTKEKSVVVSSTNPVKVQAALSGFERMMPSQAFTVTGISVPSEVADQPMTEEETLQGALNRVQNARVAHPSADYWVGIEGGVEVVQGELATFAWVVIAGQSIEGKARSGTFFLPPAVAELVQQGLELGSANDQIFRQLNSKQKGGAIGILSNGALTRKELYEQAVVLALLPFLQEELYAR
ncbi:inosine/xanthosine triphosphatase [Rufibacter glacialis]|uniref:Probable inosine/xanthosine triphosphatase n=1 Tax=Rufibacter glacialis TaxID=1259555 RepID=A0A5M8Q936_9BACT|nr:inosine/xanthosine triphosphatase [Rufibacter glacialis]KAA6432475.1 non-canonical purine NTP phosphatase [Rufibacter glacialis]GGK78964.1 non-canonical purine NTP phosphatase [Rufibacter glacialis]